MSTPINVQRVQTSNGGPSPTVDGLINYYEAEEERIINLLSRKLEKLRLEKVNLEIALEAESEAQVNRLSRELTALRRQQAQQQALNSSSSTSTLTNVDHNPYIDSLIGHDPRFPSTDTMLEALRRENESLRTRLVDLERDYLRLKRLNEVYREEIIEHRTAAGSSTENLIALDASPEDTPYSYRSHRRIASASSPSSAILTLPARGRGTPSQAVPIPLPRLPSSHAHSGVDISNLSSANSSVTHSPISNPGDSPYTFSPVNGSSRGDPASYVSGHTTMTTPPSSMSLQSNPPMPYPMQAPLLSYPSVPPPSLSSSLGSPVMPFHISVGTSTTQPDGFDLNTSRAPISLTRRNSNSLTRTRGRGSSSARVAETGSLRELSESRTGNASRSRRESVDQLSPIPSSSVIAATTSSGSTSISRPIPIRMPNGSSREGTPVSHHR